MKTASDILKEKKEDVVCVLPEEPVKKALIKMSEANIGAILVKKDDKIIGIWTERDLIHLILKPDFNVDTTPISECMTTDLYKAKPDTPVFELADMILGLFIRHIIIEKNGEFLGLLSIGDVLRCSILEKNDQIKSLNAIASWKYYENWGWERNKEKRKHRSPRS